MKKIIITFLCLIVTSFCFASSDPISSQLGEFTHVSLVLREKRKNNVFFLHDCEVLTYPHLSRTVSVPAGTEVKILSVQYNLKITHDFDSYTGVYGDSNYVDGVMYHDYHCSFTVDGRNYEGLVPGIYLSTDSYKSAQVKEHYNCYLLEHWCMVMFDQDKKALSGKGFDEVGEYIKDKVTNEMSMEVFSMNPRNRKLICRRVYSEKTKSVNDVIIHPVIESGKKFKPAGFAEMTYQYLLPDPCYVMEMRNFSGGFGGGCTQKSWLSINPENGSTFFICQCEITDADCGFTGEYTIRFNNLGVTLNVHQTDEMGEILEDSHNVYTKYKDDTIDSDKPYVVKDGNYYVRENLRLREKENTDSKVLLTMSKRTFVKIVDIGRQDTIDGISSYWVQVQVVRGKDKNGKELSAGTKGWCFGGFLSWY